MAGSERPSRRERERERHRVEILEAARKVMDARGLSGLTIEEVAREAEFAVGSIYRHFRSKEELVELLAVHVAEPLIEELDAVADGSFEVRLDAALATVLAHLREDLPLLQAFHASAGGMPLPGSAAGERMRTMRERLFAAMEAIVVRGQAEGVLPAGDPRPMTLALVSLLFGVHRWSAMGLGRADLDLADLVRRAFLEGFRVRPS
jgi:AcrR family transcriptional regulator